MDKESVIAHRDALLNNGKNRAIKIAFDNGVVLSLSSDVVVWDDDNERIVGFMADSDSGAFAAGLPIRIICSTYENIQFITGNTKPEDLDSMIDSLSNSVPISAESKQKITQWYDRLFDTKYNLARKNYNPTDIIRD